ncbi:MAG: sensor histidine kinase, partial [Halanaeroarchaeum sp.]
CESLLRLVATWVGVQLQRKEERRLTAVLQRVLRHNLRNSLNIIRGYADVIPDRPDCLPGLQIIREETRSLENLAREAQEIEDLLREQTSRTTLELDSLVGEVVADVRRANPHATIEVESPPSVTVRAISQLGFALEELLTNAIQHADRPDPTVAVSIVGDEHDVTVQVADDGPGIPETERLPLRGANEIDPVNHGSGLGLWLVRLIVQQSGGSMSVDDRDPRGTVVSVRLPRNDRERAK